LNANHSMDNLWSCICIVHHINTKKLLWLGWGRFPCVYDKYNIRFTTKRNDALSTIDVMGFDSLGNVLGTFLEYIEVRCYRNLNSGSLGNFCYESKFIITKSYITLYYFWNTKIRLMGENIIDILKYRYLLYCIWNMILVLMNFNPS